MKFYWERIRLDYIELLKSEVERKFLIETIIEMKKKGQRQAIEMVKLGRVLRRIKLIKEKIFMINEWRLECINKLVIC